MKIAFIGGRNIHKLGGIETYMYNLCTHLVLLGDEPIVYCESDRHYVEYCNGFKVVHWKSPKSVYLCKIGLSFISTMHSLIHEKGVQIFHYNAWPPSLWCWLPRLFGRKSILMGHGLEWKRTKYSPRKQKIMKAMENFTARLNNNLIMCSEEQTKYFFEVYNKKCTTVPTAINLPSSCPSDTSVLDKYSLDKNGYYLYLGRLVQDKNPDVLIEAYNRSKFSDIKLVIAGDNDADECYVNKLKALAKGNNNIIFTGAVYGDDKESLLSNCAVFCIPSTIEGLAITLLEAMSYSKPVIASDIEANIEALGDNGIWVRAEDVESLTDQLVYCSMNNEALARIGELNYLRVKDSYTWDRVSLLYHEYVYSLI